jgi:hypothetical protein
MMGREWTVLDVSTTASRFSAAVLALVLGPGAAVVGGRAAVAARRSGHGPGETAARGYRRAPANEQAAVNMLSAFLLTLGSSRAINYVLEQRERVVFVQAAVAAGAAAGLAARLLARGEDGPAARGESWGRAARNAASSRR